MEWQTVGAIAAPIIGGLIGNEMARGAETDAENARKNALAQYLNMKAPSIEEQLLSLKEYQTQGELNPLLEQLVQQGDSRLQDVSVDPRLQAEQMAALEQMSGLASGQIKPGDVAAMELARRNAAGEAQAKQGQILQEMQQRGQAGSGAELLARLKASQSGADMLAESQMQQAKMMQEARMQALRDQADMAKGIRSQSYVEQSDLARARDTIANFNTQNSQNVQSRNTQSQNQAAETNLTNRQKLANMNVDLSNAQQKDNKALLQKQFDNKMRIADGTAGQYGKQAAASQQQAANIQGMWSSIGQGVGTGIAGYGKKVDSPDADSGGQGGYSIAPKAGMNGYD